MSVVNFIFIANYDYTAGTKDELSFYAGDKILITHASDVGDWYYGHKETGEEGWLPISYGDTQKPSPYKYLKDSEKIDRRKVALQKIIDSTDEFQSQLSGLLNEVINPLSLQDTPFKRSFLSNSAVVISFGLLQELQKDSANLTDTLKNRKSDSEIATAYIQFAPSLQKYAQYAAENAMLLNEVSRNQKQLAALIPPSFQLELTLISPLRMYFQFKSDFQEYVWLTPNSDPDIAALEVALGAVITQTNHVDARLKEEEQHLQLLALQSQFAGRPDIFSPQRRLITEGEVTVNGKNYFAHLFNDSLIYSSRSTISGAYRLRHRIALTGAKVELLQDTAKGTGPSSIAITTEDTPLKTLQISFSKESDLIEWKKFIDQQVSELDKQQKGQRRPSKIALSKRSLKLPGADLAQFGARCTLIYELLQAQLMICEMMPSMNAALIQPLLSASRGAPLTTAVALNEADGTATMRPNSTISKYQADQVTAALQQDPDVYIFLRAAEGVAEALSEGGFATALEMLCATSNWQESIIVGTFFNSESAMSLYQQLQAYCSGHQAVLRVLRSPLFVAFYRDTELVLSGMPGSLLNKIELPRQMIKRYISFLSELMNITPDNHPDYEPITTSRKALESVQKAIDEDMHAKRSFEKLLDIQESFVMGSDPLLSKLASKDRHFIIEGDLKKVCRRTNKTFRFWLISDYLIYGSALSAGKYSFNRAFPLQQITAMPHLSTEYKYAFDILAAEKSMVVIAPSSKVQQQWIDAIQQTKDALLAALGIDANAADTVTSTAPLWIPDANSDKCSICQKIRLSVMLIFIIIYYIINSCYN